MHVMHGKLNYDEYWDTVAKLLIQILLCYNFCEKH